MADTNSSASIELEKTLAQNVQGPTDFQRNAERAASHEAKQAIEQSRLLEQTLIGPKQK